MKLLDSHHHIWTASAAGRYGWLSGDYAGLATDHDWSMFDDVVGRFSVAGSIAVQVEHSVSETIALLENADSRRDTFVVGWVDLTSRHVDDEIEALLELPESSRLVGTRHLAQEEPDSRWLVREDVQAGVEACGARRLAVDLVVRQPQWEAASMLVAAHPAVTFVLDHAGKPDPRHDLSQWRDFIDQVATQPNIFCKLSGLVTEDDWAHSSVESLRPIVEHLANSFGTRRIMFGSDWPMHTVACGYGDWLAIAQSAAADFGLDPVDIFHDNAVTAYRLGERGVTSGHAKGLPS